MDDTDSELSSQDLVEEGEYDDLPELIDGFNHIEFENTLPPFEQTNFIVAHQALNLSFTTVQYVDDIINYIAHPDLPATVTRVESLTSNSFKFGVQKFPWDFNSQWINSIPPGGYGITLSLRVESTVLSDITVYFGSELIADPVVEETEQEKIYTVTLVNALPLSLSDNYWELDDGAF